MCTPEKILKQAKNDKNFLELSTAFLVRNMFYQSTFRVFDDKTYVGVIAFLNGSTCETKCYLPVSQI